MIAAVIQAVQLPFGFGNPYSSTTTTRIRWKTPTRFVGKCVGHAHASTVPAGKTMLEVLEELKSELFSDPVFEWTNSSRQWVEKMLDYNVTQGRFLRGNQLIECYKLLREGEEISEDQLFRASVLAWCTKWLNSSFAILDDIMDNSEIRRGQVCWYKVPKVGNIAIVDGLVLQYQIPRIITKHFGKEPYYMDLLSLFNKVVYQTVLGQMMDSISTVEGSRDLLECSWTQYHHIATYKTACYSFYLPVACAFLLAGDNLDDHANVKDVIFEIGNYFQVVNDYDDCFGDPKLSGKIGTDIEDCRCSWLVLKALELCNEEQKKVLLEHYGKADPSDVEKVKTIYDEVGVEGVCKTYLRTNYHRLRQLVEAHPSKVVHLSWATLTNALNKLIPL